MPLNAFTDSKTLIYIEFVGTVLLKNHLVYSVVGLIHKK